MRERLALPPELNGSVWRYLDPARRHFMHRHAGLEFNLIREGSARYLLAGQSYNVVRHDLVWLFPRQEHLLVGASSDFGECTCSTNRLTQASLAPLAGARYDYGCCRG
jgi:hypothetical protein